MRPLSSELSLRQTVIYQGEKWVVVAIPDIHERHELYNLAKPDRFGRIGKLSQTRVNVPGREMQREIDLCI